MIFAMNCIHQIQEMINNQTMRVFYQLHGKITHDYLVATTLGEHNINKIIGASSEKNKGNKEIGKML